MANNPLGYDERRYEVPVFDFGWGNNYVVPNMADEDATTYIKVKYREWSQGDPEISVKFVDGEATERYGFRVTDLDRLECSYKGDDPNELPVEIQHAVYAFGYGIRNLESITQWMFRLVEAKEILEKLRQLNTEYEDLPLIQSLVEDTAEIFETLTGFIAAKSVLSARKYESLWIDVMLTGSEQNGAPMIGTFLATAQDRIRNIDIQGIEMEGDTLVVDEGIEITEKETEDGHALLVDYITPFGITRCRFLETGADKYVCQHPDGKYLPPEMIRILEERGMSVTNRDSIEHQETPLEIAEHASVFAEELQDYSFAPDSTELSRGEPYQPINLATAAFERANSTAMSLVPFDLNEQLLRTLHTKVCEQVGIDSADQLTENTHDKMLGVILENLPAELATEWKEYMESSDIYNPDEF